MDTIIYNKLVRDNIPNIVAKSGKRCKYQILSHAEYLFALDKKLQEELEEYQDSRSIEELADLVEVVYAILA